MAQVTTDERTLVERAQDGDREAFGALYDAYLTPIHDFCYRMLRNRADAEDVTAETFLKAVERLSSLKDPAAFKGWLYSIARNAALTLIDSRRRVTPVAEHFESAQTLDEPGAPQPEARIEEEDLRALVWDAASALNPRDYSVFELSVRHGLSSAEIAKALEVRPAYAYILVNRLKGSVEESLEAVLLARASECPDLEEVLSAYPQEVSPRMRKAVMRHAKRCEVCGETRKRRGAVSLLQGTAWAQPTPGFAAELSRHIDERWTTHGPSSGSGNAGPTGKSFTRFAGMSALGGALVAGLVLFAAQGTLSPDADLRPTSAETTPAPEVDEPDIGETTRDPAPPAPPAPRPPTAAPESDDEGSRVVIVDEGGQEGTSVTEGDERTSSSTPQPSTPSPEPPREQEAPEGEQDDGQQSYPPPQ